MEKKGKKNLYIIIGLIIVVLGIGAVFILNLNGSDNSVDTGNSVFSKSIKDEVITAENYDEIMDRIGQELTNDEELYYISYSVMYYIVKDGLSSAFTNPDDENAMYVNIYGKTVKKLIEEGKQLMQDNNMTIEEYKQQLETVNSTEE